MREVSVLKSARLPFAPPLRGHVDLPMCGSVSGDVSIAGWALMPEGPVEAIEVVGGDGVTIARTATGRARPDLARAFSDIPRAADGGFRVEIPVEDLTESETLTIQAVASDGVRTPMWILELESQGPMESQTTLRRRRSGWLPWRR